MGDLVTSQHAAQRKLSNATLELTPNQINSPINTFKECFNPKKSAK